MRRQSKRRSTVRRSILNPRLSKQFTTSLLESANMPRTEEQIMQQINQTTIKEKTVMSSVVSRMSKLMRQNKIAQEIKNLKSKSIAGKKQF